MWVPIICHARHHWNVIRTLIQTLSEFAVLQKPVGTGQRLTQINKSLILKSQALWLRNGENQTRKISLHPAEKICLRVSIRAAKYFSLHPDKVRGPFFSSSKLLSITLLEWFHCMPFSFTRSRAPQRAKTNLSISLSPESSKMAGTQEWSSRSSKNTNKHFYSILCSALCWALSTYKRI